MTRESNMDREASFLWAKTPPDKQRNIVRIARQVAHEMGLTLRTRAEAKAAPETEVGK